MRPVRKTSRLRFGRNSEPGANYFITASTKDRAAILTTPNTAPKLIGALDAMRTAGDIGLLSATVMPDHMHMLFTLGTRLGVGQVMGKFKSLARGLGQAPWHWEQDGFEHQLRTIESIEDYGFYIFMNPYRAGLCPLTDSWPWWICPQPSVFRFMLTLADQEAIPTAWLDVTDQIATRITTGD